MSHQTSVARPSIIAVSSWNIGFSAVLNAHAFASGISLAKKSIDYPNYPQLQFKIVYLVGPKRRTEESQANWLIYKDLKSSV